MKTKYIFAALFLGLIFNSIICFSQNVIEVEPPEISDEIEILFAELNASSDSGFYKGIEILENGLKQAKNDFDTYKIVLNLGFLYTQTEQFDKCLDMWFAASKKGICFNFLVSDDPYPSYLSEYKDNKRFTDFIKGNDSLLSVISSDGKAEYFVNLPVNYDKTKKYPVIIILHGGFGSYNKTLEDWKSDLISNEFISVYPQGREIRGSFTRSYGKSGIDDITIIYNQVIRKYSVDTTSLVLAGQSAGGALSLRLVNNKLFAKGLLLAFPVKPDDFDIQRAESLKDSSVRVVMICGEKDKTFYAGQLELSRLLDSANVHNQFIKYPNLGHGFPDDFSEQIDQGLKYILDVNAAQVKVLDNPELTEMYKNDQSDRQTENLDWNMMHKNDSLREVRVYELLDSNMVRTSADYNNAALIFQHGDDSIAYGMAVKLMRKSIELDSTRNKWLLAAAIDRDLLSRNKPQIYGTQYWKKKDQPFEQREIDTTKISDAERIEYGVETLAQQREKVKRMNRKKLLELLDDGKSVAELILFIGQEDIGNSKYDLSEDGITTLGYQLMKQGKKEEALEIFKLNTEMYPNGFNTFDSYGECLLELGYKEKAIAAYKKSLELNPENRNAEKVLSEMRL